MSQEEQYLNLIKNILENGTREDGRNGSTLTIFGNTMRFSLKDGQIPLLTTKHVAVKACFEELMWFLRGKTDNELLQEKGVHIWDGNCSREFLDNINLKSYKENELGPIYGHQWRHFNAKYTDCKTDYSGQGIDQLTELIANLRDEKTRSSRRHIVTAWNPCQLGEMALPPCHMIMQFHVRENKYLSCALFQRSADVGLGVPFNIASYSFLTHILASHCGLVADDFVYFMGNCHIYVEHIEALKTQILREPLPFPVIKINKIRENIEDYVLDDDIEWTTVYQHHGKIKMDMK
jgi:thymidylate synthase